MAVFYSNHCPASLWVRQKLQESLCPVASPHLSFLSAWGTGVYKWCINDLSDTVANKSLPSRELKFIWPKCPLCLDAWYFYLFFFTGCHKYSSGFLSYTTLLANRPSPGFCHRASELDVWLCGLHKSDLYKYILPFPLVFILYNMGRVVECTRVVALSTFPAQYLHIVELYSKFTRSWQRSKMEKHSNLCFLPKMNKIKYLSEPVHCTTTPQNSLQQLTLSLYVTFDSFVGYSGILVEAAEPR